MFGKSTLVALFVTLATLFGMTDAAFAKPARASWNGTIVEVANTLSASWAVKNAVADLDWYTGSSIHLVKKCSGKYDCVTLKGAHVKRPAVAMFMASTCARVYKGWNSKSYTTSCVIFVDTSYVSHNTRKYTAASRQEMIRHELGHWRGLTQHQKKCVSTMYAYTRCPNGSVPPNTFTAAERATLRRH